MGESRTRRRWLIGVGVVVAGIVIGVGTAVGLRAWMTAEPAAVGVAETVEQFREVARETVAVDGVYVYDTAGHERIDVLGGDEHTYPPVSAMTVTTESCGLRMTWTPLDGRSESWLVCRSDGGTIVPQASSVPSFFRQTFETAFDCADSWWQPPDGQHSWTSTCVNVDRTSTRHARVVGVEPYEIDGASRDAMHVEWIDTLGRGSNGTVTTNVWIDTTTGLLLRQRSVTDSSNDSPVGRVAFVESFDLRLRSLAPLR